MSAIISKLWSYITFQKQKEYQNTEQNKPNNLEIVDSESVTNENEFQGMSYLKMMHGINRISIIMFLIGIIIVIIKVTK